MSDASQEAIYPRYCFHLSPTFNAWCLLPTSAIHGLQHHAGFEGENFFFYRKLPIKWVRIVGVVVAIDEYAGRRVFTVDDSSGACIEATATVPIAKPPTEQGRKVDEPPKRPTAVGNAVPNPAPLYKDIEVGAVVDVKGALSTFREEKQIKIEKIVRLNSTAQEVALWEKMARFRRDVLDKPWVLRDKDIRRCRKEAERSESNAERKRRKLKAATGRGLDKDAAKAAAASVAPAAESSKASESKGKAPPTTSRETTAKNLRELIRAGAASGKYSALGL